MTLPEVNCSNCWQSGGRLLTQGLAFVKAGDTALRATQYYNIKSLMRTASPSLVHIGLRTVTYCTVVPCSIGSDLSVVSRWTVSHKGFPC